MGRANRLYCSSIVPTAPKNSVILAVSSGIIKNIVPYVFPLDGGRFSPYLSTMGRGPALKGYTPEQKKLRHKWIEIAWRRAHPERMVELRRQWKMKDPERYRAQNVVHRAVKSGKLIRGPCVVCGALNGDGHHEDYSKPLDVVWLCRACHNRHHRDERVAALIRQNYLLWFG